MERFLHKHRQHLYPNSHPSCKVTVKEAYVDTELLPVILWLNSFERVYTLYCCEGRYGNDEFKPSITYIILDNEKFQEELNSFLRKFGEVERGYIAGCNSSFMFKLTIDNKTELDRLTMACYNKP